MWKTLSDWLLAMEHRHGRESEAGEREKLALKLEGELSKWRELPAPRGKKSTAA
jgi:hypothetical protein